MKKYTLEELRETVKDIIKLNLNQEIAKKILDTLIWKITEINGKHEGVEKWSEEALKIIGNKRYYEKKLRHDHVFTRESLINELLEYPKRVDKILKKAVACIVTKEEHGRLNKIKNVEGWDRYKEARISVKKVA